MRTSSVRSYEVEATRCCTTGKTSRTAARARRAVLRGLTPDAEFSVRVRALGSNSAGASQWSAACSLHTPALLEAPRRSRTASTNDDASSQASAQSWQPSSAHAVDGGAHAGPQGASPANNSNCRSGTAPPRVKRSPVTTATAHVVARPPPVMRQKRTVRAIRQRIVKWTAVTTFAVLFLVLCFWVSSDRSVGTGPLRSMPGLVSQRW